MITVGLILSPPRNRYPRVQLDMKVKGTGLTQIGPTVGAAFPDIELPDAGGQPIPLHAWRAGRRALVVFYRSAKW